MRTKQTLAICDLDKAIAVVRTDSRQNNTDCLLAQFGKRILGRPIVECSYREVYISEIRKQPALIVISPVISSLVSMFDSKRYGQIRSQLPLELEVEIL